MAKNEISMFKNSKAIQRCALGMLLTVDPGTFFVRFKLLLGGFRITVDLPAAAAFAAVGALTDETLHILRGITQKKADFVGEILLRSELAGQFLDAVLAAFRVIAAAPQQGGGVVLTEVSTKLAGAVEINQGFGL